MLYNICDHIIHLNNFSIFNSLNIIIYVINYYYVLGYKGDQTGVRAYCTSDVGLMVVRQHRFEGQTTSIPKIIVLPKET